MDFERRPLTRPCETIFIEKKSSLSGFSISSDENGIKVEDADIRDVKS